MMFWKKRKKVKLTFYNRKQQLIDLLPPTQGLKNNVPSWWKRKTQEINITSCPGVTELYKRSISVPLWIDYEIEYDSNNIYNISVPGVPSDQVYHYITAHHPDQYNNAFDNCYHIKLMNPWLIETDKMVPFLMIDASWNRESLHDYTIPSGILEFKYQHSCHINIFLHKPTSTKKLKFNVGTRMIHLIPLEDVDLDIEYKKIDNEKFIDLMPLVVTEKHNYQKLRNLAENKE